MTMNAPLKPTDCDNLETQPVIVATPAAAGTDLDAEIVRLRGLLDDVRRRSGSGTWDNVTYVMMKVAGAAIYFLGHLFRLLTAPPPHIAAMGAMDVGIAKYCPIVGMAIYCLGHVCSLRASPHGYITPLLFPPMDARWGAVVAGVVINIFILAASVCSILIVLQPPIAARGAGAGELAAAGPHEGGALASTRPVVFPWTTGELWGNWDSAQQRQWCDGNKGDDFSVGEQPEYERHCLFVPP